MMMACSFISQADVDQQSLSEDDRQVAEFLLAGMESSRKELRSGIFRGVVKRVVEHAAAGRVETKTELFYAFDYDMDLLRLDSRVGERHGQYIRTPEMGITRTVDDDRIWSVVGKIPRERIPRAGILFFEVSALGLTNETTLTDRSRIVNFEVALDALKKNSLVGMIQESDSVHKLTWYLEKLNCSGSLWIDSSKGYSPIRMTVRLQNKGNSKEDDGPLASLTETEWTEESGVWVPTKCTMTGTNPGITVMTLSWESVNEPAPNKLFTLDDWDLPDGTYIADMRPEKPVLESIVRKVQEKPTTVPPASGGWGFWRFFWVGLNIGVVILLLAVFAYCRSRLSH